jgi:uncharacterized protein YndB with AHSA1/START domain
MSEASTANRHATSTQHATFVLERIYPASAARVFNAWADPAVKARWFAGPEEWKVLVREQDFRVGGRDRLKGVFAGGRVTSFDALYQDIVLDRRIVYTYDMHLDDARISVSLATVELVPVDGGTRLILTEQGVFLDGHDDSGSRERGTRELLNKLDAALQREPLS